MALIMVLVAMHEATGESSWLFPWGFVGIDLAVATVIAAVVLLPEVVDRAAVLRSAAVRDRDDLLWPVPVALSVLPVAGPELDRVQRGRAVAHTPRGHAGRCRRLVHRDRAAGPPPQGSVVGVATTGSGGGGWITRGADGGSGGRGGDARLPSLARDSGQRGAPVRRARSACSVSLPDTSQYRAVPLPQSRSRRLHLPLDPEGGRSTGTAAATRSRAGSATAPVRRSAC